MIKIRFTDHYYKDPKTNLSTRSTTYYIMTIKKKAIGRNLFKIEHLTKKGTKIYILYRYDKKNDTIWVINAKKKHMGRR